MIRNANIVLIAPSGVAGVDGTPWGGPAPPGSTGTSANCSFWDDTCAGFGGAGGTGQDGRSGTAGGPGGLGQIADWEVDDFGPNVRIEARGALGQTGGPGGVGGDGARCEDGGPGGNGGRGGDGGAGGAGGRGGDSGDITVRARVYDPTGCEFDTSGGDGGPGAAGGKGGLGGPIGPKGRNASEPHFTFCGVIFQLGGPAGNDAPNGANGQPGRSLGPSWRVIVVP